MNFQKHNTFIETNADGVIHYQSHGEMPVPVKNTGEWLHHWAQKTPSQIAIAERSGEGWRALSYAEVLQSVRALAGGLLARGIGSGSRIMAISGNSVDHGLMALAAQYIGAAIIPVAEQYSLIPDARARLLHAIELTKPNLIYADDAQQYADALLALEGFDRVVSRGTGFTTIHQLMSMGDAGVDEAYAQVGPNTIAKILMTSGSTSAPKAVPTPHSMLCANQAQLVHAFPFLKDRAPCVVDWLPWSHVFGGSHNFNMMLANGGSYYIDGGKPTPALFGQTIENLKMKSSTLAFNVPVGFSQLVKAMQSDDALAKSYFGELDMIFYAGASLPQEVWTGLEDLAMKHRGALPLMTTSWGLTETAPACLAQLEPIRRSGVIGVPLADVRVKMLPIDDRRYEIRVKGPNVFSTYLDAPEKTTEAFDEDGYFLTGDAMAFVDANDPNQGLKFEGRVSEEFKLLTGTWVRAGNLRMELLTELQGLVSDLVITGADRADIGILAFATAGTTIEAIKSVLETRASKGHSSSTHIARALILDEPASFADGEVTAKGNLNFRKILDRRKADLERLYQGGEGVIILGRPQ